MSAWLFGFWVVAAWFFAGWAAFVMAWMVLRPVFEQRRRERELRRIRAESLLRSA